MWWKIRGVIAYIFIAILLLGCAPVLSIYASTTERYNFNEGGQTITYMDLSQVFHEYAGSFVLYDSNADSWTIYNIDSATERVTPNSTYKIYDALLGLESGIITPDHSGMVWNGEDYPFDAWEADQDLTSAMQNSVNWYFQSIDAQAVLDYIRTFFRR